MTEDYSKLKKRAEDGDLMAYYVLFAGSFRQAFYICQNALKNSADAIELCADAYTLSYNNLSELKNPYGFQIWINYLSAFDAAFCLKDSNAFKYLPQKEILEKAAEQMDLNPEFASKTWSLIQKKIEKTQSVNIVKSDSGNAVVLPKLENSAPGLNSDTSAISSDVSDGPLDIQRAVKESAEQAAAYKLETQKKKKLYGGIAAMLAVCIAIGSAALGERLKHSDPKPVEKEKVSDEKVNRIASLLSGQLSGQIGEVYQISEDTYYLVIYVGGEEADGALAYYDEETGQIKLVSENPHNPDGSTQTGTTQGQGEGYLSLKFSSSGATGGVQGNVDYILEEAIAGASEQDLFANDNKIDIDKDIIEKLTGKAEDEKNSLEQFFELNDDGSLNIILRIRCLGVDFSKPFVISLDSAIADLIGNAGELQVIINDDRHAINITRDQLSKLCSSYGTVSVSVFAKDSRTYDVEFFDKDGNLLSELFGEMTFILPADSELTYVYAQCPGGSFARNGKYSKTFSTMSFPVWSSGIYTMMGNNVELSDISELSEDEQKVVVWAVNMGLMKAGPDGKFDPSGSISTAEMQDSLSLLASIVLGETDGDKKAAIDALSSKMSLKTAATREECSALCSETLSILGDKSFPENYRDTIVFADRAEISASYLPQIGLLVDERILENSSAVLFRPREMAQRIFAADLLNKMYSSLSKD